VQAVLAPRLYALAVMFPPKLSSHPRDSDREDDGTGAVEDGEQRGHDPLRDFVATTTTAAAACTRGPLDFNRVSTGLLKTQQGLNRAT
jgi:hypothetical protein